MNFAENWPGALRSGHAKRRSQGFVDTSGKILDRVMISERPAEVVDRAVPGHWEGDLILGANNRSAVGTLVERSTRFVLLLHLGKDHSAAAVEDAMRRAIATRPGELVRSVTWDQGKEMSNHRSFTVATGAPIYFCDPHSPPLTRIKRKHERTPSPIVSKDPNNFSL